MTDSLRDRIAAVICDMDALHAKQWALEVADAVIEALDGGLIGYQIWNAAEWISVNSGWMPYEIYRSADGTGGGWRLTVQRIEAANDD